MRVCVYCTEVVGTRSPLCDVDKGRSSRDVQDLMVTQGNRDILEASCHSPTGALPPTTHSTPIRHSAGVQYSITALGLMAEGGKVT